MAESMNLILASCPLWTAPVQAPPSIFMRIFQNKKLWGAADIMSSAFYHPTAEQAAVGK